MSNHPNFREEVPIQDEHFADYLSTMAGQLPEGWRVFSAMTENGLHAMGCEMKGKEAQAAPTLVQIPGHCHRSSAFRKTWLPHARDGIQTIALTPPGTKPSATIPRPVGEWGLVDYFDPMMEATKEVAEKRDFLVMEGHSLGGLLALHIAARAHQIDSLRNKIRAWIGINSIKPPNISKRLKPFELPNKSEELSFKENPQNFLKWIHDLFDAQTDENIEEQYIRRQIEEVSPLQNRALKNEALKNREGKLPKDFPWIIEDRKSCRGPLKPINDYGYDEWAIDPSKVNIPLLDVNGTSDNEDISGTRKDTKTENIIEPAHAIEGFDHIRLGVAGYYSLNQLVGEIKLAENDEELEKPLKNTVIQQNPRQNCGRQVILRGGPHNLIELERFVEIVCVEIRDLIRDIKDSSKQPEIFTLVYK